MIEPTQQRVQHSTAEHANQQIRRESEQKIELYGSANRTEIDRRLEELEREWDIERALEANASSLALAGLLLGTLVDRRWYALPAVVAGFLLQHAIQGWCPPLPLMRRLGFRTSREIAEERMALKALRGDFRDLPDTPVSSRPVKATQVLDAVRK